MIETLQPSQCCGLNEVAFYFSADDPGSSKLVISKDRTELTMRDICKNCEGETRSDLQVFMCRISNKHGENYASAYLNVIGRLIGISVDSGRNFLLITSQLQCKLRSQNLLSSSM